MGYERKDRQYGRDQSYGYRPQGRGREYERGYDRGEDMSYNRDRGYDPAGPREEQVDYGRRPQGYEYDDRGFFDRAGDEVRSWFGDEEAERRRRWDERNAQREYERNYGRSAGGGSPRYAGGTPGYSGYGATAPVGAGDWGMGFGMDHSVWGQDPNYHSWRSREVDAYDRDYEEYRREHQARFDNEFGAWRRNRQTQRDSLRTVKEHQEVVGSDGAHIGTVDHVRGDRILLTKSDQDAGGHHHSIPSSWITRIDEKVEISKTAEQAKAHWRDEEHGDGPSGDARADKGSANGPHNLNRSFSGTY